LVLKPEEVTTPDLSKIELRLQSSEEEVQLLCEAIDGKEKEIKDLHEEMSHVRKEKSEALTLLSEVQGRQNEYDQTKGAEEMPLECVYEDDDDEGISLGLSRPSLSPTSLEIVTKHSELLDDLVRMKSAIHNAISPSRSFQDESISIAESTTPIVSLLQEEINMKNRTLSSMEEQIDDLMDDVSKAREALGEKEKYVEELTTSLCAQEEQKMELRKKLKSRKTYIKQLEAALSYEVKHRREMEDSLNSAQKERRTLATDYKSKSEELASAHKEIEKKSHAVKEQMETARQMARQLQTTKQKIFALKSHLQKEGLLRDGSLQTPVDSVPSRTNSALSNDSLNWSVSDEESEDSA